MSKRAQFKSCDAWIHSFKSVTNHLVRDFCFVTHRPSVFLFGTFFQNPLIAPSSVKGRSNSLLELQKRDATCASFMHLAPNDMAYLSILRSKVHWIMHI